MSQRVPCPPRRPAPARVPCAAYPCLTPVLCAASPCARVRIHCAVLSLPAAGFFLRSAARVPHAAYPCARPRHPHSLIPPCRGFCPSAAGRADIGRDTAPARPRPPRGLTLPDAGSVCRVVLRAARLRPLCGLTQRTAGFVRRVALRARPHPLRSPIPACRRFCVPRRPTRPPAAWVRAYPARPRLLCGLSLRAAGSARLQFCLRSAGKADIGSEPARTVPAASPCAPPPASSAQPYPSVPRVLSVRRGKGGYWQGASACRARRVALRPPAFPVQPIPA